MRLEELGSDSAFKGVVIKAEHETTSFNTRLAKRSNDIADEIVKTNFFRLESDLKKDTFEKETADVI